MMSALFKRPGRHAHAIPAEVESWHVILHGGVDIVTECQAFVRVLLEQGRVRVMVANVAGARVEVIP